MMEFTTNYTALVVSAAAAFALGMVWWHPKTFGKVWMKAMSTSGRSPEKLQKESNMKVSFGLSALGWVLAAYILGHVLQLVGASGWQAGVQTAFWMWLGFTGSLGLNAVAFEGQPKEIFWINQSYYLVGLMVIGAILASWS